VGGNSRIILTTCNYFLLAAGVRVLLLKSVPIIEFAMRLEPIQSCTLIIMLRL
jgi:hypothetical protein